MRPRRLCFVKENFQSILRIQRFTKLFIFGVCQFTNIIIWYGKYYSTLLHKHRAHAIRNTRNDYLNLLSYFFDCLFINFGNHYQRICFINRFNVSDNQYVRHNDDEIEDKSKISNKITNAKFIDFFSGEYCVLVRRNSR